MNELRAPLLVPPLEVDVTIEDVHTELERISNGLGRDFANPKFLTLEGDQWFYNMPKGMLHSDNWHLFPRVGTEGNVMDSPIGFAMFFLVAMGLPLSEQQREWADFTYECWNDGVGAIIEASRGFGKSIFMRGMMAYLIGILNTLSFQIIRASNTTAQKTAEGIAKIISNSPAWQMFFPHIKPKSQPGQAGGEWSGQAGYSVVDMKRIQEWATVEAARTSPTLTKFGYGSKLLGNRVSGALLVDDIHDRDNAESVTQLEHLVGLFIGDILPMLTPQARQVIIGTPWGEDDLLQTLPETGVYRKFKSPVTLEGTYPGTPAWPQRFGVAEIDKIYMSDTTPGKKEFKRNYLLDLYADVDRHFTYQFFPHGKVEDHWPIRFGIDFAALEAGAATEGRSYFSVTVTAQEPVIGSWIVIDGFVGQVTQSQAERVVIDLYNKYGRKPRVEIICVETAGSGQIFEQYLARLPLDLPLVGEKTGGVAKEVRWENTLEPNLASEKIKISDQKHHPFLTQLIRALNIYPNVKKRGDMAADILDSMVWAHFHAFLEYGDPVRRKKKKEPAPNPWLKVSRM